MLIFAIKIMKPELIDGAPPGTISSCDPSGWIQQHIFTERFQHCLSFAKTTNEDPAVLVSDGNYSHARNLEVIFPLYTYVISIHFVQAKKNLSK
jgi:hypothetical protein